NQGVKPEQGLDQDLQKVDERVPAQHVSEFMGHHQPALPGSSLPGETLRQVNATVEDAPDERLAEATNQTELGPAAKSKRVHQVQKLAFQLHVRQGALAFQ